MTCECDDSYSVVLLTASLYIIIVFFFFFFFVGIRPLCFNERLFNIDIPCMSVFWFVPPCLDTHRFKFILNTVKPSEFWSCCFSSSFCFPQKYFLDGPIIRHSYQMASQFSFSYLYCYQNIWFSLHNLQFVIISDIHKPSTALFPYHSILHFHIRPIYEHAITMGVTIWSVTHQWFADYHRIRSVTKITIIQPLSDIY